MPFRPLRDKYALFRCLIIYLSPVNGFIIVFILYLHTRPGAFLIWYTLLFPHMAPALYATVRTDIYNGSIRYCMRDQQSRGHGLPWPQLDTIAITFLFSLLLPSAFRRKLRLSSLWPCALNNYRLLNQVSSFEDLSQPERWCECTCLYMPECVCKSMSRYMCVRA